MVIIDSLKLIFPCDVFVGVFDRIQCHFFCRENDGDQWVFSLAFTKPLAIASMIALQVVKTSFGFHLSRSIWPRSVQLSPMGSELGWGLLADQSESRKFLCPNMERLCAALKSAAKIYTCSASRKCTAQFQGFAIISRYKVTYWGLKMTRKSIESSRLFQRRLFTEYRTAKSSAG